MLKTYTKQIKQFGAKVKSLREQRGFTQQYLADCCEIDIRTVQRIERGDYGVNLHIIYALANALQVQPQQLLEK